MRTPCDDQPAHALNRTPTPPAAAIGKSRRLITRPPVRAVARVEPLERRVLLAANPAEFTDVSGSVFFTVDDGTHGRELWKSDGTNAGTVLVKDIYPGATASDPRELTSIQGTLFFVASDEQHGRELWKSDGTTAGTVLVTDITAGPGDAQAYGLTAGVSSRGGDDVIDCSAIAIPTIIDTGDGNDVVTGSAGSDEIDGGPGNDRIFGHAGNDTLTGRAGKVTLYGSDGNDELTGGAGWDLHSGQAGNDRLFSHDGRDDEVDGGDGGDGAERDDLFDVLLSVEGQLFPPFAELSDGVLRVDGTDSNDQISLIVRGSALRVWREGERTLTVPLEDVERIEIDARGGDDGIDWTGIAIPTLLIAGAGNDIVTAGAGSDTVLGGDGNDKIHGGNDYDLLSGNAGNDQIDGGLGNDRLNGDGGNDKLFGGAGLDRLYGYAGRDYVDGGSSGDRLDPGIGVDSVFGQGGDDRFYTQDNEGDALYGGSGADLGIVLDVQDTRASVETASLPRIGQGTIAVVLEDFAAVPLSGRSGAVNFASQLGRANFLRAEPLDAPLAANRFFVNDLDRHLYIVDESAKSFTSYLNFEAIFPKFDNNPGFAGGLVTFAFDPEYATNGKIYTVHTEDPAIAGPAVPDSFTGFTNIGYTTTAPVNPPGGISVREGVLVEWTDTNVANSTFLGSARELLRVGFNATYHPMADLLFNPNARPGDADYRNLYIANGDGRAGETADAAIHPIPQRLDALQGKILRITPDLTLRASTSVLGANGRYRVPASGADPNPFVHVAEARPEVFAYGLRNPHRMTWDAASNQLIVTDIGLGAWEEVNLIHKGANYGYGEREGTEQLFVGGPNDQKTGSQTDPFTPFPLVDALPGTGVGDIAPKYPVAQYRTNFEGDAISSGFVYRGTLLPELNGKFVFGEITTGRVLYCDLTEMMAADDGDRTTLATISELAILHDSSRRAGGLERRRLFDVVVEAYAARGGDPNAGSSEGALPGFGTVTGGWLDGAFVPGVGDANGLTYGGGRADIRLALGGDGEIYILSKSDGFIRKLTGAEAVVV